MPGADDAQLKDFQGLPISELIVDPLVSAAKGQKKLAGVTLDFVSSIGFEPDPDDPKKTRTRTVDVEVERLIKGRTTPQKQMVKMPLLTMVTIPNLSISDVKVHFDMEVKSHSNSHTGSVTTKSENTRETDFSARYSIDVEATQNPPAEGLARFTQMLASTLEPVDTQAK